MPDNDDSVAQLPLSPRGVPSLTVHKEPSIGRVSNVVPEDKNPWLDKTKDLGVPNAPIPETENPWTHHQELRVNEAGRPYFEQVPNKEAAPAPTVPQSFMDRVTQGNALSRIVSAAGEGVAAAINPSDPLGFSPESEEALRKLGIFRDPERGLGGPIRFANEAMMKPAAAAVDLAGRLLSAVPTSLGYATAQASAEIGGNTPPEQLDRQKKEAGQDFNLAAMLLGTTPSYRVRVKGNEPVTDQPVGGVPSHQDFSNAAHVLTDGNPHPELQLKLQKLWDERGIHPAEAVADANDHPDVKQQLLSNDTVLPEAYGLTPDQLAPGSVNLWNKRPIATRILPNGKIVPAPEAIATYLQKFGDLAGFKFMAGPPGGRGDFISPHYQALQAGEKRSGFVYLPSTSEELNARWYGLNSAEIALHEVGHALDHMIINKGRGTTKVLPNDPLIKEEMLHASHEFRPKLWEQQPQYNQTPVELMADSIAAFISNPERRKLMPEFEKRYGARLDPYVKMAEKALPQKVDGEYVPPGGEGGNFGGGGNPPPAIPGEGNPRGEEPKRIPGPKGDLDWARKQIDKQISVGGQTDQRPMTWSRLYTNLVDQSFPMAQVTNKIAGKNALPVSEDPYKNARLFSGWAGKAERMIHYGTFDYHTYQPTGPSLDAILSPVKNDIADFRRFIAAARSAELNKRGIPTGFDQTAVQIFGRAKRVEYQETFKRLVEYQNEVARYLKDSGVLSEEGYAGMLEANKLFVPFHVVLDANKFAIERVSSGLEASNPIRRINGSLKQKIDPLETIIKNTYLLTSMAEKNSVTTKLVDMLLGGAKAVSNSKEIVLSTNGASAQEHKAVGKWLGHNGGPKLDPLEDLITEMATPEKPGHISIFRDGKRETYAVDEELARSVKNLDRQTMGLAEKLLAPMARTLRAGAILNPEFAARHLLRDYIYSFIKYPHGVFTPLDTARGLTSLIFKDKSYWDWQMGGGGQVSLVALDRRYLQEDLDKLSGTGIFTRGWNTVIDPEATWLQKGKTVAGLPFKATSKYVVHPLQVVADLAMSANHLGGYKKRMRQLGGIQTKDNVLDAAWTSRETGIDMSKIGASTRAYNAISAFANAKIQDTTQIMEALKDRPVSTSIKIAIGVTLPSVLLWVAYHDDSRIKDASDWEKDEKWLIPTDKWEPATPEQAALRQPDMVRRGSDGKLYQNNGVVYRLPKPFSTGVLFGSGAERLLDAFAAEKPHAWKGFGDALLQTTVGDLVPNTLSPMLDQGNNRSNFSGRTIIPGNLEGQLPEYQYSDYTTETAKAVGKWLSGLPLIEQLRTDKTSPLQGGAARALSSPILIENYVRAWTGGIGQYTLQALDYSLRKQGIVPDPVKAAPTLSDIPFVRAFVMRYPSASTQSISDFYAETTRTKQFYDTFAAKAKEGDADAMARIQAMGGPQIFARLDGMEQAMHSITQAIHQVNKDQSIQPYEKRQLIDNYYYQMIALGRAGTLMLEQVNTSLKTKP
jgi:hypothetical protein